MIRYSWMKKRFMSISQSSILLKVFAISKSFHANLLTRRACWRHVDFHVCWWWKCYMSLWNLFGLRIISHWCRHCYRSTWNVFMVLVTQWCDGGGCFWWCLRPVEQVPKRSLMLCHLHFFWSPFTTDFSLWTSKLQSSCFGADAKLFITEKRMCVIFYVCS